MFEIGQVHFSAIPSALGLPLSSNRQHYEIDDCLEENREDY